MAYRCEAASVEGFVQYLACNLINKGYWFYVTGNIPPRKDPKAVDQKLVDLYGLGVSKWARARRKARGKANAAYVRFDRYFVLLVTQGEHPLLIRELDVRDVRRQPIQFHGYSIGCSRGSDGHYHTSVKLTPPRFEELRSYFRASAARWPMERIVAEMGAIDCVPYARIRRQLLRLLREVNELRKKTGLEPIPPGVLPWVRKIVRVFRSDEAEEPGGKQGGGALLTIVKRRNSCDDLDLGHYVRESSTPGEGESGAVTGDGRRQGSH